MNQTHFYDGKWKEIYQKIKQRYTTNVPFKKICDEIVIKYPQTREIINLLLIDRKGNYDHINQLTVEEILPLTWQYVKNTELETLFIEQLLDIKNGPCAQGRTTRIFQLLYFYE